MYYLLATILLNTIISALFKLITRYGIDSFQAIVINYWVCVATGSLFIGSFPISASSFHQIWAPWALLGGIGFISVFNLFAYCTAIDGITTSTIANKLSLAIPVVFSILLYGDHAGPGKVAGIALAFPAVYLTSKINNGREKQQKLLWPALLFAGSGLLDTLMKYSEQTFLPDMRTQAVFTTNIFACAGAIGTLIIIVLLLLKKTTIHWKNIVAGIFIGIPNFFSIYYFIRLLNSSFLQSSAAIPINNIGIVVVSSLMAIIFFREPVTKRRIAGLALSIVSILLIAFGDNYGRSI